MIRSSTGRYVVSGTLGRRTLLKAGVAGLLLPQASLLRAAQRSDVIVLGAGLSGLYSAMLLEDLGYKVQVLEAWDQVGGRVKTRQIAGVQHEMGASEVGTLYARVRDTISRVGLNLTRFDIGIDPFCYHIGGQLLQATDWESADVNKTIGDERAIEPSLLESRTIGRLNPLQAMEDWLKPENLSMDVPLATYLRSHGVSQAAVDLIGQTIQGSDINRTSALTMLRDSARVRAGFNAWRAQSKDKRDPAHYQQVEGGMQRLPKAMAANLEGEVLLNKAAVAVEQDNAGVTVTCSDGSRYQASRLISTMSLPAMRQVDFKPGLSAAKVGAIRDAQYYETTKFYLRPTEPFWEQDGFTASIWTDGFLERVFAVTDGGSEVHTLLVWINGAGTAMIDSMNPTDAGRLVLQELARIRPASEGKVEIVGHYSWGRDPYIGGCGYSYGAGEVGAYAQALPLPEGRLYFAGEHTRRLETGMESAMASGERAVRELAMADMF